jgi:hypothetical protein
VRNLVLGLVVIMSWNLSAAQAAAQETHASHQTEQTHSAHQQGQPEQNMSGTMAGMGGPSNALVDVIQNHTTSGTDAEPASTPIEMLMATRGKWTFMFHGEAFLNELQQSGARGGDKLFSTNWFMPMAQHSFGRGTLTVRSMLSFEPATVSKQRYPELFQQGETAFGTAIVDGQHPHDFIMELAAMYDYKVGEHTLLSLYAAPMGDPAMGPVAYPHRQSASEDPIAPLGHHLQDSTHIADDVITVGLTHRNFRIEGSGFHGREPDEFRWDIDSGKIDSWSTRATLNPTSNLSAQFSIAQLHSPEAVAPTQDLRRMTASATYNQRLKNGNWATMLLWGRNQSLSDGNVGNSYLLESTLKFMTRNAVWGRVENVDRTNELLPLASSPERYFARVQAYTIGYDREMGHVPHLSQAIGGQVTWYGVPQSLIPFYGTHPVGVLVFFRVRFR